MQLPSGKKMAGQGLLYVRVNENSAFCYENRQSDDDSILTKSCFDVEGSDGDIQKRQPEVDATLLSSHDEVVVIDTDTGGEQQVTSSNSKPNIESLINKINERGLSDPVEILRLAQMEIVKGRPLEMTAQNDVIEGDTNYISVDRDNILLSTFEELSSIDDFNITFEVDFMAEMAQDLQSLTKLLSHSSKNRFFSPLSPLSMLI